MKKQDYDTCGVIYMFTNLLQPHMRYVGKWRNLKAEQRAKEHQLAALRPGRKTYFHSALAKYGAENFELSILDIVPVLRLSQQEQYFIKALNTKAPNGYNLTDGGEGMLNPSSQTRRRLSKAHKGVRRTDAEKAALSAAHLGVPLKHEHCALISTSNKKYWKKLTAEERSVADAHLHTPEAIAAREAILKANPELRVGGPEKAAKCSAASKAAWADEAYRAARCEAQEESWRGAKGDKRREALSKILTGQKRSAEGVENIRVGAVKGWASRSQEERDAMFEGIKARNLVRKMLREFAVGAL